MPKIKPLLFAVMRIAAALAASLSTAAPADANDWATNAAPASYIGEFGMRLWFGRAHTAKNLFDSTGTVLVSRLDYGDLNVFTGEAFSRIDFNGGWFLKGYVGGGGLFDGKLKDEDFPPVITPYSATNSDQRTGYLYYGSVDAGFKVIRGGDFHLGAFVGYHFLRDSVSGYGCSQIATNPIICAGGIPDSVEVITQTNDWHALRLGLEGVVEFNPRWKLDIDAAWLPYVRLFGKDAHWLRIGGAPGDFTGPIPEDGKGWGYQFDAFLTYRVNNLVNLGVGGRYWHVQSDGLSHFEGRVVGVNAAAQAVHWKADHFGVFLQSSVKFGAESLIGS